MMIAWLAILIERRDPDLLRAIGLYLWRRDSVVTADILYVLGGDYSRRIPHALQLYREGLASKIVLPYENLHLRREGSMHFTEESQKLLLESGVPSGAIILWRVGSGVGSTADEMRALRVYLETFTTTRRVIVVTSAYHSRRAGYTAQRFAPSGVQIQVSGVEDSDWSMENWWRSPRGNALVQEEWKKLVYYYVRYLVASWMLSYSVGTQQK